MEATVAAIDVGTSKICTLVGQIGEDGMRHVIGVGVVPSRGLHRGVVTDMGEAARAIKESVQKAERVSGYTISEAYVGVGGGHIASQNSRGAVAIGKGDRPIDRDDIERAIEAAAAIAIPYDRRIIHRIPREFIIDGYTVENPLGMMGFRLEVEVHIITGSSTLIQNLIRCVEMNQIEIADLVVEPLASAEAVLTEEEKRIGVALLDMGGGTTDMAIFVERSPWDTHVLGVGGYHLTRDIAVVFHTPLGIAEDVKIRYAHANPWSATEDEVIEIPIFGNGNLATVARRKLCEVVGARIEEMFELVLREMRRSGFDGLLPAGVVVTGGTAALPGIRDVSAEVLKLPVRVGIPRGLRGLVETISSPAYATSVGLLMWGMRDVAAATQEAPPGGEGPWWRRIIEWIKANFTLYDQ